MSDVNAREGKMFMDDAEVPGTLAFGITRMVENSKYASSDTNLGKNCLVGNYDWNGTGKLTLPDGSFDVGFDEGDEVVIKAQTTVGKTFTGTTKIIEITNVDADLNSAEVLSADFTFEGHGRYTNKT